jgi:hypothetical protein
MTLTAPVTLEAPTPDASLTRIPPPSTWHIPSQNTYVSYDTDFHALTEKMVKKERRGK